MGKGCSVYCRGIGAEATDEGGSVDTRKVLHQLCFFVKKLIIDEALPKLWNIDIFVGALDISAVL